MIAIVAADENYGIGKDNNLLVRISPDLKRLKAFTIGNIVVMGSKTYLSFPKRPLPGRENIVLTRHPESFPEKAPELKCISSIDELLEYEKTAGKPIFVLGGGEIYRQLLPYCDKIYLTRILHTFPADTFFPDLSEYPEWKIASESEIIDTEEFPFKYVEYVRE